MSGRDDCRQGAKQTCRRNFSRDGQGRAGAGTRRLWPGTKRPGTAAGMRPGWRASGPVTAWAARFGAAAARQRAGAGGRERALSGRGSPPPSRRASQREACEHRGWAGGGQAERDVLPAVVAVVVRRAALAAEDKSRGRRPPVVPNCVSIQNSTHARPVPILAGSKTAARVPDGHAPQCTPAHRQAKTRPWR